MGYPFLKGHGTENDFVLLPDHDGSVHGALPSSRVSALCNRRSGIGGDGVLRVIRAAALREVSDEALPEDGAEWFMDYRNADGSRAEMCGNGIRLFARHLVDAGLAASPVPVGTRDGVKVVRVDGDRITAEMGVPRAYGWTEVGVGDQRWPARHLDMGNPHAVAFVGDLGDAGTLLEPPLHDPGKFPTGVNVEFVVRRSRRHVAMRVHERGSGETRSCGTGACAVMVASALADGVGDVREGELVPPLVDTAYRVDVPGGDLVVTWTTENRVLLSGPAVVVATGETDL